LSLIAIKYFQIAIKDPKQFDLKLCPPFFCKHNLNFTTFLAQLETVQFDLVNQKVSNPSISKSFRAPIMFQERVFSTLEETTVEFQLSKSCDMNCFPPMKNKL